MKNSENIQSWEHKNFNILQNTLAQPSGPQWQFSTNDTFFWDTLYLYISLGLMSAELTSIVSGEGYFPDPYNCRKYWNCIKGSPPKHILCPDDEHGEYYYIRYNNTVSGLCRRARDVEHSLQWLRLRSEHQVTAGPHYSFPNKVAFSWYICSLFQKMSFETEKLL